MHFSMEMFVLSYANVLCIYPKLCLQAGIKIAGRNINNLRYTDDTTLRAESEEEK